MGGKGNCVRKSTVRRVGFTLVELMITIAILAILAAIAYPAYQDQLRKGRRAAAQSFVVDVASREQQYLLDARAYAVGADALTALSLPVPPEVGPFYTVAIEPAAATIPPTYTIRATPIPGSSQQPDGELTMNQAGQKTRGGQPGW